MDLGPKIRPTLASRYWKINLPFQIRHSVRALAPAVLAAAMLAGCVARFEAPGPDEPRGLLVFPSQEEQWFSGVFLEPLEFNGVARPRHWTRARFGVPPGLLELRVRAARENLQGACLLSFTVSAGANYEVAAAPGDEAFTIRVMREGRTVTRCTSPATLLPTPLGPPPGVPGH